MTLYLSSNETALLSEDIKNNATIEVIDVQLVDSKEDMAIRQALVKFEDPALQKFANKVQQSTPEEYKDMFEDFAHMDITEEDLMEMFYLMGPDILTAVLCDMLEQVDTINELEPVAEFSEIRKAVYDSYVSTVI